VKCKYRQIKNNESIVCIYPGVNGHGLNTRTQAFSDRFPDLSCDRPNSPRNQHLQQDNKVQESYIFNGSLLVSKNFSSRAFKAVRGGLCQARPGIIDRFTFQPAAFYRHAFKPQLRARRRDEQKSVDVTESECQCLVRTSITILTTTAEHKQSFYCSHNARPEAQIDDNKCTRGIGQPTYLHHSSLTCVH